MNTTDILRLMNYVVDSGLKPGTSLLTGIHPDDEMTLEQGMRIIDEAVKMQKRHARNLANVDFPADGDTVPMTEMQAERLYRYVKRLSLPKLNLGDVCKLSYNESVRRLKSFSEMYNFKAMTPDEIDELYAYMQSKGVHGDQIDCRGKTLAEAKAEVDAM